jgi:crotonobetainyl-CoA:carnitine CoA-transferase CaiB-like acyl-CoA transferase
MLANGLRDRAPLYGCGHRASYAAGVAAYAGMLAALFERQASGKGQHLDVSVAETAATMSTAPTAFAYSGRLDSGRGHSDSFINCRGEWVLIWIYPVQWPDFCAALDLGALVDDPRFADKDTRQANWREFIALLQSRFGDTRADDVVGRLQARRLITAKAASLTGLLAQDAHLASRQFWQQQDGALRLRPAFVFDAADDR